MLGLAHRVPDLAGHGPEVWNGAGRNGGTGTRVPKKIPCQC